MRSSDILIRRVNRLFHEMTQDSFDEEHWWRHRAEHGFWVQVGRLIGQRLRGMASGGRRRLVVADVGCGTGFATGIVGGKLGASDEIIAIDVTEAALKSTVSRWNEPAGSPGNQSAGQPRLACLASDAQKLPLADGSLDCVLMNAALHHFPLPERTLAEIDRVLRPGGLFALGFEPNRGHFESPALRGLARGLDRASWYASVHQNRRRLRQWLDKITAAGCSGGRVQETNGPERLSEAINARLLAERLVDSPLTCRELMDLVDPHARGAGTQAGFDPADLLRRSFPGYAVLSLTSSDYLGESVRKVPLLRGAADRLLRAAAPRRGLLFSWVIQKPTGVGATKPATIVEADDLCPSGT